MKKHALTLFIVHSLSITICSLLMTACPDPAKESGPPPPQPIQLATPSGLQADGETKALTWSAVTNASGYRVDINGKEEFTYETSYSLLYLAVPGTYTIKVKALGDWATYTESGWSVSVQYTVQETIQAKKLAAPSGLQIVQETLTWTAVDNASGYTVNIDGKEEQADTVSFSLSSLSNYKTYTIKVKAKGDGTTYTDSEWSGTASYTLQMPVLDTPGYVQIEGTNVTWDAVVGAVRYSVDIDGTEYQATGNSYSLSGLTAPKIYTIKVKSIGDNVYNKDSGWSQSVQYTVSRKLAAPTGLQITGATLTWTAVSNASSYTVDVSGWRSAEYSANVNSCSLSGLREFGHYNVKVKAIGNGTTYTDSEWSLPKGYDVISPTDGLLFELMSSSYYRVSKGTATATEIVIPPVYDGKPVTTIRAGGFKDSTAMTRIYLYDGLEVIERGAFSGCTGLTSITIPNSVTSIEIPDSINLADNGGPFSGCSGLTGITVESGNTAYRSEGNCLIRRDSNTLILGCKTSVIPGGVTGIGHFAFSGCIGLKDITIPGSVTSIGNEAFSDCIGLTGITIPNSVTSIGNWAFRDCSELTDITIPNSVTSIGAGAFRNCSKLTDITIPFVGQTLNGGTTYTHFGYIFGSTGAQDASSGAQGNSIPASLKTVVITGGSSIANNAFNGCSGLTSVTIPGSVKSIGNSAFYGCSELTDITIPDSVTSIGNNALSGCNKLTDITIPFVGATSGYTNSHFGYLFGASGYSGQNSSIPASLKTVVITGGNMIDNNAFNGCIGLASVTIPGSVTRIGDSAFSGCIGLTGSLTIPGMVASIGLSAFNGCSGLTSVTIPASVTKIDNAAFYGCSELTSVTFATGSNIDSRDFGANAFPQGTTGVGGESLSTNYLGWLSGDTIIIPRGGAGTYTRDAGGTEWRKVQ